MPVDDRGEVLAANPQRISRFGNRDVQRGESAGFGRPIFCPSVAPFVAQYRFGSSHRDHSGVALVRACASCHSPSSAALAGNGSQSRGPSTLSASFSLLVRKFWYNHRTLGPLVQDSNFGSDSRRGRSRTSSGKRPLGRVSCSYIRSLQKAHTHGALTLNRLALGVFFAISGYHKLFNPSRHAALTRTLQDDGVHALLSCGGCCPPLSSAVDGP
jgi:hypothetical protein